MSQRIVFGLKEVPMLVGALWYLLAGTPTRERGSGKIYLIGTKNLIFMSYHLLPSREHGATLNERRQASYWAL